MSARDVAFGCLGFGLAYLAGSKLVALLAALADGGDAELEAFFVTKQLVYAAVLGSGAWLAWNRIESLGDEDGADRAATRDDGAATAHEGSGGGTDGGDEPARDAR